jgi:hypothetical protein
VPATTACAVVRATTRSTVRTGTERDAGPAAFKEKYGTNKNKKNAFGKCVSATAKADDDEQA